MTKQELRIKYKLKRQNLSSPETEDLSLQIANRTLKLPVWDKTTYSLFLSIQKQKEINTEYLLHILQGKDKNIAIHKSHFKTREMQHFLLTDNTQIRVNPFGIPEPVDGIEVKPTQIDVIFIPLLVFDLMGNRIGYGKGFYDRFLARCRTDAIKVGLSFFEAESTPIPVQSTDIALDYCVTPDKLYDFGTLLA